MVIGTPVSASFTERSLCRVSRHTNWDRRDPIPLKTVRVTDPPAGIGGRVSVEFTIVNCQSDSHAYKSTQRHVQSAQNAKHQWGNARTLVPGGARVREASVADWTVFRSDAASPAALEYQSTTSGRDVPVIASAERDEARADKCEE